MSTHTIELMNDMIIGGIATIFTGIGLIPFYLKATKENKENIWNIIIGSAILWFLIIIILEIGKLIFFYNFNFLKSLDHIKLLGYMLGGIIAILGFSISYLRFKALEKQIIKTEEQHKETLARTQEQHEKTLKEQKFKNAVELLSSTSSSSRLLGTHSLVELTLDHENANLLEKLQKKLWRHTQNKFLDPNIRILLIHLQNVYNLEIKDLEKDYSKNKDHTLQNEYSYDNNGLITKKQYDYQELKNKYTSENYSTSQEILLTFQHIMNLITHINDQKKLYDINIPFKNINIDLVDSNFKQLTLDQIKFTKELYNVEFHNGVNNVEFKETLNKVEFHNNVNNVEFHKNLNKVTFGGRVVDNTNFHGEVDHSIFECCTHNSNFDENLNDIIFFENIYNISFNQQLTNVDFREFVDEVQFHQQLKTSSFHGQLDEVKFYGRLNHVLFSNPSNNIQCDKNIINNLIREYITSILGNNNANISLVLIQIMCDDEMIQITNNYTNCLHIEFEITIDNTMFSYNQNLYYELTYKRLFESDKTTLYGANQLNNDLNNDNNILML